MLSVYTVLKRKMVLDDFGIFVGLKLSVSWYFQNSLLSDILIKFSNVAFNTYFHHKRRILVSK